MEKKMNFVDNNIEVPEKALVAFCYLKKQGYLEASKNTEELIRHSTWWPRESCGPIGLNPAESRRRKYPYATAVIEAALGAEGQLNEDQLIAAVLAILKRREAKKKAENEKRKKQNAEWELQKVKTRSMIQAWLDGL